MEGMRLQRAQVRNDFLMILDATSNRLASIELSLEHTSPEQPSPRSHNICDIARVRSQTSGGETSSRVASATAYNVRSYKNMRTRGVHLRVVLVDAWGRSPGAVCGWVWLPGSVRAVDILKMIPIDVTAGEATLR